MTEDKEPTKKSKRDEGSTFPHLRPLSVYSQMICDQPYNYSSPCNIKVLITNRKRLRDDSCLDETFETPLKKTCIFRPCSPDQGCIVESLDFLSGVQGSTPVQALRLSKDVTAPRSKVIQPVTPVVSTPLSKCLLNRLDPERESLPSPIPVLSCDRKVPLFYPSLNFSVFSSINGPLTGFKGSGKGNSWEVSHKHIPVHESKRERAPPERVVFETVASSKEEEGVSVSALVTSDLEATVLGEDGAAETNFESSLPLQLQVRSKLVIPETTKTRETQSVREQENDTDKKTHNSAQRPVVFRTEEEWETHKKSYVDSVKKHMMESNGLGNERELKEA
ncbi:uncharacterized protein LOC127413544 isoform X2 [Myxocyprinus asiaticus]|uniref:uncharacterized protein LOC127413544 isoform X2 n=1 Tax=Myxocyprinus asiaticus TaxID=70543 RepID=UPI002222321D|nr:uncharacterized protein LOC127413544 isoform X2 [Myxocyprinus asiaticus]